MRFKIFKNKEEIKKNSANLSTNFNKKTREKQIGRSMVEMLGVLAIIGVLSIGGIQGYTIAMRKYRANEIVNALQKYSFVFYQRCDSWIDEPVWKSMGDGNQWECQYAFGERDLGKEILPFSDAGVGPKPNDILSILDFIPNGGGFHQVITTNSGDIVRFYVIFKNKEICQSVLNVIGTNMSGAHGVCEKKTDPYLNQEGYLGLVSFIMN